MIDASLLPEPVAPALRPVARDDRRRLPWRFLARHITLDALRPDL